MGISTIFFFLSCILILSPALMNLIKHWRDHPDHCCHAFHFKEPDLEAPRTFRIPCFDQPSFKVTNKLCSILRRVHGCSFCERWLQTDKAVFFYCDMRFCSDECRAERMKIDDAKEKMEKLKNSCSPTQYSNAKSPLYIV